MSNDQERIIIVAHRFSLSFLQTMFIGDSFEDYAKRHFVGTPGGVSKIMIEPGGEITVPFINRLFTD